MEAIGDILNDGSSLRRWNRALAFLTWLGIGWTVYLIADLFFSREFTVGVTTTDGIKVLSAADFSSLQRCVVSLIMLPMVLCWLYCLLQVLLLTKHFAKGEILSIGMVRCLLRFGYGMAVQGIAEMVHVPILASYLIHEGIVDSVQDIWEHVLGSGVLTSLMAAVLIVLIARILSIGIRLREDAELTI